MSITDVKSRLAGYLAKVGIQEVTILEKDEFDRLCRSNSFEDGPWITPAGFPYNLGETAGQIAYGKLMDGRVVCCGTLPLETKYEQAPVCFVLTSDLRLLKLGAIRMLVVHPRDEVTGPDGKIVDGFASIRIMEDK